MNFNDIEEKKEGDKEGRNDKVGEEIEEGGDKDKGGGHNEKELKIDEEKSKERKEEDGRRKEEEEKGSRNEGNLEEWLGVGKEGMRERMEGGEKALLEGWFRRGSEEKSRFFKG